MLLAAFETVYARYAYTVFGLGYTILFTVTVLLLPNVALLRTLWNIETVSLRDLLGITNTILQGTPESVGIFAVTILIVNALLLSVVLNFAFYIVRHKQAAVNFRQLFTTSGGGTLAAVFGVGCVACGPLLFGGFFAAVGASGLLLLLPWHGAEFELLAALLLCYAIYSLAKVITAPQVCSVAR